MTETSPKPLPLYVQFGAGAFAGIVELLCMYPLDVVKTRLQLQGTVHGVKPHYGGILDTLTSIVRNEGPGRLYRGIAPMLLLEAPKRAIKFGAFDFWGKTFRGLLNVKENTQSLSVLTGCAAGATESLIVVPFEMVKIQLQDRNQASLYRGPVDVVRAIVRDHGISGLYTGMWTTMVRHVLWSGGYFGSIHKIRGMMPKPTTERQKLMTNFVSGTIGGTIGTVLNTPADVVKTRIQRGGQEAAGVVPKYTHMLPSTITILREEGVRALYKGFWPKVLRLAPGGGIMLLVVEGVLAQVRVLFGPPYI